MGSPLEGGKFSAPFLTTIHFHQFKTYTLLIQQFEIIISNSTLLHFQHSFYLFFSRLGKLSKFKELWVLRGC